MNEDLATIILSTSIKSAGAIGDLASLVSKEEEDIKEAIGYCVYDIHRLIINPILDKFPKLREDVERRLGEYGRFT